MAEPAAVIAAGGEGVAVVDWAVDLRGGVGGVDSIDDAPLASRLGFTVLIVHADWSPLVFP